MREKNIRIISESSREIQALKVGPISLPFSIHLLIFVMSSQEFCMFGLSMQ